MTAYTHALQDWYLSALDGDAAPPGLRLSPSERGWAISVDLSCGELTINRTVDDWLHAWIEDGHFRVDCGPLNLTEAIRTSLEWAGWMPRPD